MSVEGPNRGHTPGAPKRGQQTCATREIRRAKHKKVPKGAQTLTQKRDQTDTLGRRRCQRDTQRSKRVPEGNKGAQTENTQGNAREISWGYTKNTTETQRMHKQRRERHHRGLQEGATKGQNRREGEDKGVPRGTHARQRGQQGGPKCSEGNAGTQEPKRPEGHEAARVTNGEQRGPVVPTGRERGDDGPPEKTRRQVSRNGAQR